MRKSRKKYAEDLGIRINGQIRADEVRVLTDDGENLGVMSTSDALKKAQSFGLDLVEVSGKSRPAIAKITDYGKYKYELKRKTREAKQKQKTVETKTVQVKVGTGEGDLMVKAKNISKWLKEGHRIKLELFLRGRIKYAEKDFLQERMERVYQKLLRTSNTNNMSSKTNKSLTKRIKITKNGKLKVRAEGHCHYNARENNSAKMAKKKMGDIKLSAKTIQQEIPHST